jgi:hypothetical protein
LKSPIAIAFSSCEVSALKNIELAHYVDCLKMRMMS